MSKNIVVFSDGTGQDGGNRRNTNVYKLFNMVENRTKKQISFYDRGLGTGWRKVSGNVAGTGISKNIIECYEFIFNNFEAGDKIYLFGFSRGATTVRSLASFIHLFGILPKSRPELIKRAYKIYRKTDKEKRDAAAKAFIGLNTTMWARVHFLGVWDTVAALGIPIKSIDVIIDKMPFLKHSFQDLSLSPSVTHAVHALAIDEERKVFSPTPWHIRDEKGESLLRVDPKRPEYNQTVKQVWFCGVHTDVGGGYEEQQVSDIPLVWMMQQAVGRGLRIYPRQAREVLIDQNVNGKMHDSRGTLLTKLYRRQVRSWDEKTCGPLVIHDSVLQRALDKKSDHKYKFPYDPWILKRKNYATEPWDKQVPGRQSSD